VSIIGACRATFHELPIRLPCQASHCERQTTLLQLTTPTATHYGELNQFFVNRVSDVPYRTYAVPLGNDCPLSSLTAGRWLAARRRLQSSWQAG